MLVKLPNSPKVQEIKTFENTICVNVSVFGESLALNRFEQFVFTELKKYGRVEKRHSPIMFLGKHIQITFHNTECRKKDMDEYVFDLSNLDMLEAKLKFLQILKEAYHLYDCYIFSPYDFKTTHTLTFSRGQYNLNEIVYMERWMNFKIAKSLEDFQKLVKDICNEKIVEMEGYIANLKDVIVELNNLSNLLE